MAQRLLNAGRLRPALLERPAQHYELTKPASGN
jgi:hypothetical protein